MIKYFTQSPVRAFAPEVIKKLKQEGNEIYLITARADEDLKKRLLATEQSDRPLEDFCAIAAECGFDLTPGEILRSGQDYYDNLFKSCNGAAATPIEEWADAYEMFMASLW